MSLSKTSVSKLSINVLYDAKTRSSFCWKYFGHIIATEDNKKKILNPDQVYCSACLTTVKAETEDVTFGSVKIKGYNKTVSTGNLTRHLRDDHQIRDELACNKAKTNIKDFFTVSRPTKTAIASCSTITPKHDKWLLARDVALWFSKSLLPFDSISDEGMVDFFKKYGIILNENDLPSRYTVSGAALSDVYECMLSNVKGSIAIDASRHCALTFDLWTDQYRKLNYITFTLHYLTANFELKSLTLCTQIVTGKKTGENINDMITNIKNKFGLFEKYIHAVTDAGSNVKRAVSLGNMDHHLCLGHGLHNLVTVDGIDSVLEVKELVNKCKKIVKTLRYRLPELESEADKVRKDFLDGVERVVETLEIDENDPITQNHSTASDASSEGFEEDMATPLSKENVGHIPTIKTATPTRWHSILEMLESLIHACNRDPVNNMLRKIGKEELRITQNEWNLLEDLVKFLKRFREAVEIMSSQKTCTMNVALVFRSEIIDVLESLSDDDSLIIFKLKRNMMTNINKRFPVTKPVVAAALLDKRFMGLKEIDSYLETQNMTKASFLASYVKEIINSNDLPGYPEENETVTSVSANTSGTSSTLLNKLSKKHSRSATDQVDDPLEQECWRYLASEIGSADLKDDDLLSFWNEKKNDFPWISTFARALLCIPATSTPSERVFSIAGMILSAKRSRLSPHRVNKIIFIHDNYKECKSLLK